MVVTNGDVRFPNLITTVDGRTALVDWDGGGLSSSATELGVAQLWCSLFQRADLQRDLVARARAVLDLDRARFAAAVAACAALEAALTTTRPARCRRATEHLRDAVDGERFEQLWG